jgi:hypothetical protein
LPRAFRQQERLADEQKLARILLETGEALPESEVHPSARGSDWRRMRGVPVCGPGIGGTAIGTDPVRELLRKERQRPL